MATPPVFLTQHKINTKHTSSIPCMIGGISVALACTALYYTRMRLGLEAQLAVGSVVALTLGLTIHARPTTYQEVTENTTLNLTEALKSVLKGTVDGIDNNTKTVNELKTAALKLMPTVMALRVIQQKAKQLQTLAVLAAKFASHKQQINAANQQIMRMQIAFTLRSDQIKQWEEKKPSEEGKSTEEGADDPITLSAWRQERERLQDLYRQEGKAVVGAMQRIARLYHQVHTREAYDVMRFLGAVYTKNLSHRV